MRIPSWREICFYVCKNGHCTPDGEAMAPQYEYKEIGKKVRIIEYGWFETIGKEETRHMPKSKFNPDHRFMISRNTDYPSQSKSRRNSGT